MLRANLRTRAAAAAPDPTALLLPRVAAPAAARRSCVAPVDRDTLAARSSAPRASQDEYKDTNTLKRRLQQLAMAMGLRAQQARKGGGEAMRCDAPSIERIFSLAFSSGATGSASRAGSRPGGWTRVSWHGGGPFLARRPEPLVYLSVRPSARQRPRAACTRGNAQTAGLLQRSNSCRSRVKRPRLYSSPSLGWPRSPPFPPTRLVASRAREATRAPARRRRRAATKARRRRRTAHRLRRATRARSGS